MTLKVACLVLGVLELLGAGLWCLAGAGIYGSPLAEMSEGDLLHVWAFLLVGPFAVLPFAVCALWRPAWGAVGLLTGGLISAGLAVPFLLTDASVFPHLLVSFPMFVTGSLLIRQTWRLGGNILLGVAAVLAGILAISAVLVQYNIMGWFKPSGTPEATPATELTKPNEEKK